MKMIQKMYGVAIFIAACILLANPAFGQSASVRPDNEGPAGAETPQGAGGFGPGNAWDNGAFDGVNGHTSERDTAVFGTGGPEGDHGSTLADDFMLSVAVPISEIRVCMLVTDVEEAELYIYSDDGGEPGPTVISPLFGGPTTASIVTSEFVDDTTRCANAFDRIGRQFIFNPTSTGQAFPVLPAGKYWLAAVGDGEGDDTARAFWATSTPGQALDVAKYGSTFFGETYWTDGTTTTLGASAASLAFDIDGEVDNPANNRATFKVTKTYDDGNDVDDVLVSIDCNTGLILDQDKLLSDGESVEFVVTSFSGGSLNCTITEDGETGYAGEYTSIGDPNVVNAISCEYLAIEGGDAYECEIVNSPLPVDVKVTKEWVYEGSTTQEVSTYYTLTLYCDAYIDGGYKIGGGGWEDPAGIKPGPGCGLIKPRFDGPQVPVQKFSWCKAFPGNGPGMFTGKVTPEFPDSNCMWVETGQDSAIEVDQSDCVSLTISAGNGDSCVITNTVFYEGIPTLSQYGMALLALLMLGVGFVSFRRFS